MCSIELEKAAAGLLQSGERLFLEEKRERERKSKTIGNNFVSGDTVFVSAVKNYTGNRTDGHLLWSGKLPLFPACGAGVDGCDLSCKCARGAFDASALWGQPGGNAFLYGTFRQRYGAFGVFFPERQNAVLDRVSGRIRGNQPVLDSDDEPV